MSPSHVDVTVKVLRDTLNALLEEKKVSPSTRVALLSDEEGNQVHYMWGFSIDTPSDFVVDKTDPDIYHSVPIKGAKRVLCFIPAGDEIEGL